MPEFRRDFATVSARIARLQPWLDKAHRKIVETNVGFDRLPILF
jgi:guanine deaminase